MLNIVLIVLFFFSLFLCTSLLTLGWFWVCKGSLLRMPGKKQKNHSVESALNTPKKDEASCDSQKEDSKEQTESTY